MRNLRPSGSRGVEHIGEHCKSYGDEPGTSGIIEAIRETPVKYLRGIQGCPSKKVIELTAQLKGPYTSAHNEHELEATVLLESCDPLAFAEPWGTDPITAVWLLRWKSCGWCHYRPLKKGSQLMKPCCSTAGGITLTDSYPAGGLQPPQHLLGE